MIVNARTGDVRGNHPYSTVKIILAVLGGIAIVGGIILVIMMVFS